MSQWQPTLRHAACAFVPWLGAFAVSAACAVVPVAGALDRPKAQPDLAANAREIASLCARSEVRTWHYFALVDGQPQAMGRAWGRCEALPAGSGAAWRLLSRFEVAQGERTVRGESEMQVASDGKVVAVAALADGLRWQARRSADVLTPLPHDGLSAAQVPSVELQPGDGFLGFMTPYFEEVMLASHRLQIGDNRWRVVSIGVGSVEPWFADVQRSGGGLRLQTSLGESIVWVDGELRSVEIESQRLSIRAVRSEPWPTWTLTPPKPLIYVPPADATWSAQEHEIPPHARGDGRLAGEILVPNDRKSGAPAVLFLGSSVPADRYGFAGPPAVDLGYHHITDALAQAGFVVLRFDARGRGGSGAGLLSWKDDKEDARRALFALLASPHVDPARVLVVGHGEGGLRALHLASAHPGSVAGVALLAAPAISQAEGLAEAPEVLGAIRRGTDLPAGLMPHLRWLQEILDEDPVQVLGQTRCPLFVVEGVKDFELDAVRAHALLRKAALARPMADPVGALVTRLEPALDHLLRHEPATSSQDLYLERRPIAAQVVVALVEWARATTSASPETR